MSISIPLYYQRYLRQEMQWSFILVTTPTCLSLLRYFGHFWPLFWQLNLNWFKSCVTKSKCKYILLDKINSRLTHQMIYGHFTKISDHFLTTNIHSFTELKLTQSFWGAEQLYILTQYLVLKPIWPHHVKWNFFNFLWLIWDHYIPLAPT